MTLKSVNTIIDTLKIKARLQEQPFQMVLKSWSEIVGQAIAIHTRPISIERGILRVATKSAALAQNLTFERQGLLLKINAILPVPISDIRFSNAAWYSSQKNVKQNTNLPHQHPSFVENNYPDNNSITTPPQATPKTANPNSAFENWAKSIKANSQNLPLCPECGSPTPPGELQRWGKCSLCAAKEFSHHKYRNTL